MADDNGPIVQPGPGGGGGDGTQAPYAGYRRGVPLENYVDPTQNNDDAADTAAADTAPSGGPVQDLTGTADKMPEAYQSQHPGDLNPNQIRQIKQDIAGHKATWRRTTYDNPVQEADFQRKILNSSWGMDFMSRYGMSKQDFLNMVKTDPTYDYRKAVEDNALPPMGSLPSNDGKGHYYMSPYAPGMWSHYYKQTTGKDAYDTGVNNKMFNDMLSGAPARRPQPPNTQVAFSPFGKAAAPAQQMRDGQPVGPDGYTATEREYMKGAGVDPAVKPAAPAPAPAPVPGAPPAQPGLGTRKQQQQEDLDRIQKGLDPLQGQKPRTRLGGVEVASKKKATGGGGTLEGAEAPKKPRRPEDDEPGTLFAHRKEKRDQPVEEPEQVTADTETA